MERTPQTLVIDASAACKWFLEEDDSDRSVSVRDAHIEGRIRLTAPDLIVYEVANALNYNSRSLTRNSPALFKTSPTTTLTLYHLPRNI